MTPLERAIEDMKNGSIVANVAVFASRGEADDWPVAFRNTAMRRYGLGPFAAVTPALEGSRGPEEAE